MKFSHKLTGTIGDLSTSFPVLSSLSKIVGKIDLTLPNCYQTQFNGIQQFLEYQDFIGKVDFNDDYGDFDLQCHPYPNKNRDIPIQTFFVKQQIESFFGQTVDIDFNLKLKVPHIEISEEIKNKNIIVDRTKTNVLYKSGLYRNLDENYWINPTISEKQIGDDIIFNINVCIQTNKKLIVTPTGLPIILQHFNKPMTIMSFDRDGELAKDFAYFAHKKNLTFVTYEKNN
jgi:hypothetical protein